MKSAKERTVDMFDRGPATVPPPEQRAPVRRRWKADKGTMSKWSLSGKGPEGEIVRLANGKFRVTIGASQKTLPNIVEAAAWADEVIGQ